MDQSKKLSFCKELSARNEGMKLTSFFSSSVHVSGQAKNEVGITLPSVNRYTLGQFISSSEEEEIPGKKKDIKVISLINLLINTSREQDLYSPTMLKNIFCLILLCFVNLNVTQLLIG